MCCGDSQAPAPSDNKFTDVLAGIAQDQNQRAKTVFQPLEDQAVADVQKFNTADWKNQQIGAATADVQSAFGKARASQEASDESLGVNPADGSHAFVGRGLSIAQAGADAAATTGARERADTTAFNALAGMSGRGDAKIGQSISAANAGGQQYVGLQQNQLKQEGMDNQGMAGIGSLIGTGLSFFSSKKLKTGAKAVKGALEAVRKMPMNRYRYKKTGPAAGMNLPEGEHVGPYAEDFADATGTGDGKTIKVQDAIGTTMAAVKQLDRKVTALKGA